MEEGAMDMMVPDNPDNGVTSSAIKVGWMGDLTGPTASSQSFNSHGIEAYFECANESGGVLGRMIEYLPEDDQFSAETAAINFTKLTEDDKVIALLGLGGSHISTQLQPDVEALNLPVIGPPQTIDVQLEGDQYFNNLAHYGDQSDLATGQIAADVGGIENAVVMGISLEVPSGTEFAAYVEQSVNRAGGTYLGTQYVAPGATEVIAQMAALQEGIDNDGAHYVTLHGSPAAGLVVMQGMADAGITDIPISVNEVAADLMERLPGIETVEFRELTEDLETGIEVVVYFLAVLELYKRGLVDVLQATTFGRIAITWTGEADVNQPLVGVDSYEG